jgi:hypothetical protein
MSSTSPCLQTGSKRREKSAEKTREGLKKNILGGLTSLTSEVGGRMSFLEKLAQNVAQDIFVTINPSLLHSGEKSSPNFGLLSSLSN